MPLGQSQPRRDRTVALALSEHALAPASRHGATLGLDSVASYGRWEESVQLATDDARARFAAARSARLATVREDGAPHLIPVVFAVIGERIVHVVDAKPKQTLDPWQLQRIRNILRQPRVAFLADAYDEDWSTLWWVRADATATVLDPVTDPVRHGVAVDALAERYEPYRATRPTGPVISASVIKWTGWAASAPRRLSHG